MLKGKCAVITGASRGIGKCIATKFAKEGANVVINYRNNEEEALKVKKELEDLGSQVLVVKADVSELEQAENLIKEAKKEFGRVDILVNNAGITKDNKNKFKRGFQLFKSSDSDNVKAKIRKNSKYGICSRCGWKSRTS